MSTILFSNPSSRSFENGRLFGSAHTRSSRAGLAIAAATGRPNMNASSNNAPVIRSPDDLPDLAALSGQPEHIERASWVRGFLQVLHHVDEAERRGGVSRVEIAGHDRACPTANPGKDGDVLPAVRPSIAYRLADDARRCLELPKQLAGLGFHRLEPTLHRPVKHHIACGDQRTAP